MNQPDPLWLGLLYGLSELWLAVTRRSGGSAVSHDRKSLTIIWIVICVSVLLAVQAVQWLPAAAIPHPGAVRIIGFFLFLAGLALRWYAIGYLGKFFTVDVAIHAEQQLIETGPYRFVRHPSYSGALLAFVGLGFYFSNWWSLIFLSLPVLAVFLARIQIEERAMIQALGERYCSYQQRTKRLVPWLY